MEQTRGKNPRVINVLIGLGLLVVTLAAGIGMWVLTQFIFTPPVTFVFPTFFRTSTPVSSGTPEIPLGKLGTLGVACGGPERFPCMPGLVCSVAPAVWESRYGTCVRDTRQVYVLGGPGEACDAERGCRPGLTCVGIPEQPSGTCEQNPSTP